ncbi:MAG: C40 family peptidase [Acidimicrobiales bacterium]
MVLPLTIVSAITAGATVNLSDAQQKAAEIEAQIQSTGQQVDALDQRYEAALATESSFDTQISTTDAKIGRSKDRIGKDKTVLRQAAVQAYVTGGSAAGTNAVFDGSQTAEVDSSVYDQVITGNLNVSVADLNTAVTQLGAERKTLDADEAAAAQAATAAQTALAKGQALEAQEEADLGQVKGQIATLVAAQQAAAAAAAQAAAARRIATAPPIVTFPPPAGGDAGAVAVRAAESQLGVPYVWGAEDPGGGFDCSGLTAWAWGRAGVGLPHYSGAQMDDSSPVPVSDLQPGDLLFYGPGGSVHVAMYVGGGEMIEATFPGTVVRIDPVRFGSTFAGAGRP